MKMVIEIHAYAPELNKILFVKHGETVAKKAAPGIESIRAARAVYFQPITPGRVATVSSSHGDPKYAGLNRSARGRISSYTELLNFVDRFRQRHAGGELLDGSILPHPKISVKTKMIG
ncbi:hypothetical protein KASHIRA_02250 [Serratia phage vB_SmaM-Kashira]|nr:hypothetical protein KASHIRA_02250 [Serratia phage vB_SmaM-Kashira]